ncbi:hypothetical protein MRB53_021873 [Persea americana]|uniref:Uncharacterized protein n=1 Tax=Persea americana TaxID=3435 RepID=A0ACC2L5L6_PERAE|nr:hypothetical protein MRB53_021873 [Persea americana]
MALENPDGLCSISIEVAAVPTVKLIAVKKKISRGAAELIAVKKIGRGSLQSSSAEKNEICIRHIFSSKSPFELPPFSSHPNPFAVFGRRLKRCSSPRRSSLPPPLPPLRTHQQLSQYTKFGGPAPHRPVEDLAFAVARFIQKGGSFINYYMAPQLLKWILSQLKICLHSPVSCFLWPTIRYEVLESYEEVTGRRWMFNWI